MTKSRLQAAPGRVQGRPRTQVRVRVPGQTRLPARLSSDPPTQDFCKLAIDRDDGPSTPRGSAKEAEEAMAAVLNKGRDTVRTQSRRPRGRARLGSVPQDGRILETLEDQQALFQTGHAIGPTAGGALGQKQDTLTTYSASKRSPKAGRRGSQVGRRQGNRSESRKDDESREREGQRAQVEKLIDDYYALQENRLSKRLSAKRTLVKSSIEKVRRALIG